MLFGCWKYFRFNIVVVVKSLNPKGLMLFLFWDWFLLLLFWYWCFFCCCFIKIEIEIEDFVLLFLLRYVKNLVFLVLRLKFFFFLLSCCFVKINKMFIIVVIENEALLRISGFKLVEKWSLSQFLGEVKKDLMESVTLFPLVELPPEGKSCIGHEYSPQQQHFCIFTTEKRVSLSPLIAFSDRGEMWVFTSVGNYDWGEFFLDINFLSITLFWFWHV